MEDMDIKSLFKDRLYSSHRLSEFESLAFKTMFCG